MKGERERLLGVVERYFHRHWQQRWWTVSRKDPRIGSIGASAARARDLAVIGLDQGLLASV